MMALRVLAGLAAAALAAGPLAGCASSSDQGGRSSSSGASASASRVIEDAALTARVKTALTAAGISPTSVHVTTAQGGVVQLSGLIDDPAQARRAGEIARQVQGVKQVFDDIRVVPRA